MEGYTAHAPCPTLKMILTISLSTGVLVISTADSGPVNMRYKRGSVKKHTAHNHTGPAKVQSKRRGRARQPNVAHQAEAPPYGMKVSIASQKTALCVIVVNLWLYQCAAISKPVRRLS